MMNYSIQKQQQKTSGYKSIPHASAADDEETTAVPFFGSSSKWRVFRVAGAMLLLVMAGGGGTVWRRQEGATAAMNLVVATTEGNPCIPAGGAFGGTSTKGSDDGEDGNFETCYQYHNFEEYCWTKSFESPDYVQFVTEDPLFFKCVPNGGGQAWKVIDADYVNTPGVNPKTNPKRCGPPCQGQHPDPAGLCTSNCEGAP